MIFSAGIILVIVTIALGGFFSGSETGVYRLSRFLLRLGKEQNKPFYHILSELMDDGQGLVFSILAGNNLVNYISTSVVTLMLLQITSSGQSAGTWATIIMTPVLFVFSEVLPKNIYYYKADVLMPRFAALLWFFDKIFKYTGIVWLLKQFSRLFDIIFGASSQTAKIMAQPGRSHIRQLITETHEEGILSGTQNDLINRVFDIPNIYISSVMVPLLKTTMVRADCDREEMMNILKENPYSRYPVYENNRNSISGYINIYEVLDEPGHFDDIRKHVKDIVRLNASMSVTEAIETMSSKSAKIALVTALPGQRRKILGMLTIKDLVEELTGELGQW